MSGENKHSPEPWRVVEPSPDEQVIIDSADGDAVVWDGIESDPADLRRIVACVNALAGIPTEALEGGALEHALSVLRAAISFLEPDQGQACIASLRALGRLP